MNKVTVEPITMKVDINPLLNKADVEVIRIHTDYNFLTFSQTSPEHKEA